MIYQQLRCSPFVAVLPAVNVLQNLLSYQHLRRLIPEISRPKYKDKSSQRRIYILERLYDYILKMLHELFRKISKQ